MKLPVTSIKVTIDGNAPDGTATHSEWTGKFDGKDYPSTGNPNEHMRSNKQIDDHTLHVTSKKGGKVVLTAHVVTRPMARVARSQPMEPMHRARNTRALHCTTSSKGIIYSNAAIGVMPFRSLLNGRAFVVCWHYECKRLP